MASKSIHPASPCLTCRFFVRAGGAHDQWCAKEVLDRYPQPLYDAATCQLWERK